MKKIRWGIIGAGDIVKKRIVTAIRSDANSDLIAVARRDGHLVEAFAKENGIPRWYSNHLDLLADPDVDAVYIASPVFLHLSHTSDAARAGKHVLCEKPMAMTAGECEKMIDECSNAGVNLGIAYYRRFYPVMDRVKQALRAGEIGKPVFAQVNAFEAFNPDPEHPRRWFIQKDKSGGGPMMDFGCHRIEILLDIFGPVVEIRSVNTNARFDREVEDTSSAIFLFANGACASLTVTHAAKASIDSFNIYGTEGSIEIKSLNSGEITISNSNGGSVEMHPPSANFHVPLIQDFTTALISGRAPAISGEIGREVARIVDEIYGR